MLVSTVLLPWHSPQVLHLAYPVFVVLFLAEDHGLPGGQDYAFLTAPHPQAQGPMFGAQEGLPHM